VGAPSGTSLGCLAKIREGVDDSRGVNMRKSEGSDSRGIDDQSAAGKGKSNRAGGGVAAFPGNDVHAASGSIRMWN